MRQLLDRSTRVDRMPFRGGDVIANVIEQNAGNYQLKEIRILNTDVVQGTGGTYDVTVNTLLEGTPTTTARFLFQYEQRTDGLLLSQIVPLNVGSMTVDQFARYVISHGGH